MENKDWAGISPNWDFYEKKEVLNLSKKEPYTSAEIDAFFENDIHMNILNHIDELKERKWYRIKDAKKMQAIKDLMDWGFLPDVSFNDDLTHIRKIDTEDTLKLLWGNG